MPLNSISEIEIGKIDGKNEFLDGLESTDKYFFDSFLLPSNIDPSKFRDGKKYFVYGFRGTGKTSLLRWYAGQLRLEGFLGEIILFKSDLTPIQRQEISNQVGVEWAEVNASSMEMIQDFKESWRWFVFHKIGEFITKEPGVAQENEFLEKYLKLLGLSKGASFQKVMGFFPKLSGSKIKINADVGFFKAELQGDFEERGTSASVRLDALNSSIEKALCGITFNKKLYFFFDELEVFFHSEEQYRRDIRMVRDILFITDKMNKLFSKIKKDICIISSVRSEILDAMGPEGEEVNRLVYDQGAEIAWHYARRNLDHPLIEMIRRKIWASEMKKGIQRCDDPIDTYFPRRIQGMTVDEYLLDRSFYKPRDLVWRLSVAINTYQNEKTFGQDALDRTGNQYSTKLWDEVKYELSALYSNEEISIIESVFSGKLAYFDIDDVKSWFQRLCKMSSVAQRLVERRTEEQVLHDLYRLGAIGNAFRVASRQIRNRWIFRGDPTLLPEKRMELHSALVHRLSAAR